MPPKRDIRVGPLEIIPLVHVLLCGLYACLWRPVGDLGVETDFFGDYLPWARQWMMGHPSLMSGYKGPTYYLVLGLFSRLVAALSGDFHYPPAPGPEFLAGKLISVLASGVVLLAMGRICRRVAAATLPPRAQTGAVWACSLTLLVVATNPTFIDYSIRAGTDMFAVALAVAAVAFALGAIRGSAYLGSGALLALGYLTRYNNIVLLPVLMLLAGVKRQVGTSSATPLPLRDAVPAGRRRKHEPSRAGRNREREPSVAARCGYLAAGFAAVAAPWWVFSLAACGDPFYSRNVQNAAFEVFGAGRVSVDDFMAAGLPFDSALDLWRADPGAVLSRFLGNVPRHLLFDVRQLLLVPIALVCAAGLACAFLRSAPRTLWIGLTIAGALLFTSSVPIYYSERYALPMLPFYALGCTGLAAILPGERMRPWRRWFIALGVLAFLIGYGAALRRSADPKRSCEAAARLGGGSDLSEMGKRFFAEREYCACLAPLLFAVESGSNDWEVFNDLGWISLRIQRNPGRARNYLLRAAELVSDPAERQRIGALVAESQAVPAPAR